MTDPTPDAIRPDPEPTWQLLAQARLQADSAMYAAHRVAALMVDFARVVAERDDALAALKDVQSGWEPLGLREAKRERDRAEAAEAEVTELRDELRRARFEPLGDNHHNAAACPYCSPERDRIVEAARRDHVSVDDANRALAEERAVSGRLLSERDAARRTVGDAVADRDAALAEVERLRALVKLQSDFGELPTAARAARREVLQSLWDDMRADLDDHAITYGPPDQRFRDGLSHAAGKVLVLLDLARGYETAP